MLRRIDSVMANYVILVTFTNVRSNTLIREQCIVCLHVQHFLAKQKDAHILCFYPFSLDLSIGTCLHFGRFFI
jgi:hypothetical protein